MGPGPPVRRGAHRVGAVAAAIGSSALLLLPFATFRGSRIQSGIDRSLLASVGLGPALVLVALWALVIILALRDDGRPAVVAMRGFVASAIVVAAAALSEVAAVRLTDGALERARVSIGPGAWLTVLAAWALVAASRRELGRGTPLGVALSAAAPLGVAALLGLGRLSHLGMVREYRTVHARFPTEAGSHVLLSLAAIALATVLGVSLGLLVFRWRRLERPVFWLVNVFQTVPGLALIGLLVGPLAALSRAVPGLRGIGFGGLGWAPVVTALTLYGLLAVARNTFAGLRAVPAESVEAGLGMGMTSGQLMRDVRVPLAMPVLLAGVRTAIVQTIGNAALGAFAAAGTLGLFVFGGLSQQSMDLVMLGSLAVASLALLADGAMRVLARAVEPRRSRSVER